MSIGVGIAIFLSIMIPIAAYYIVFNEGEKVEYELRQRMRDIRNEENKK